MPHVSIAQSLPSRPTLLKRCLRAGLLLFLLLSVCYAGYCGWTLRPAFWEGSQPLRFRGDINNGFAKGAWVLRLAKREAGINGNSQQDVTWAQFLEGYRKLYDTAAARARVEGGVEKFSVDYTPLRLLVMSIWVKQVKAEHPDANTWREEYTPVMLQINRAMESAGAVLIGVLVWVVARRSNPKKAASTYRVIRSSDKPLFAAAIASVVFWFNPSTLINTHAWPQWDVWLIPFYLLAMLLAVWGRFFGAGMAIAVGAMLKGQILFAAPVFLLWALFDRRLGRALHFVLGFACGLLLCASIWLVPTAMAWVWLGCITAVAAVFASTGKARTIDWSWWLASVIAMGLIVWPWLNSDHVVRIYLPLLLLALLMVLPLWLPRRAGFGIFALCFCLSLGLASHRFDGSWNWFRIGYMFPTYQHYSLVLGFTCNLPRLFQDFGWNIYSVIYTTNFWGTSTDWTIRHAFTGAYAVMLILCGLGAAIQSRRNDPRLLIALVTPWILSFALLSQMHERYLMWGAALAGVGIASSVGMGLLQWVLIACSSGMMLHDMIYVNDQVWPLTARFLDRSASAIAWVVILTAMIYLYQSIVPGASNKTVDAPV